MKRIFYAMVIFCFVVSFAGAQEDQWRSEERMALRDAVVRGEVLSLEKFVEVGSTESLWIATISIEQIIKPHKLVSGETIQVYFLSSEGENDASSHHVHLTEGRQANFYLDARPLFSNQNVLFIEFPSDVQG